MTQPRTRLAPPVMTRVRFSSAFLSAPLATVGSPGDGKFSLYATASLTDEFTYCTPTDAVILSDFVALMS